MSSMGMTTPVRIGEELKGPKELHMSGEGSMDGTNFKPMFDMLCRK
jgi:hypothetical protein